MKRPDLLDSSLLAVLLKHVGDGFLALLLVQLLPLLFLLLARLLAVSELLLAGVLVGDLLLVCIENLVVSSQFRLALLHLFLLAE